MRNKYGRKRVIKLLFEANGKCYTLEEVKDYWGRHNFVCYNDSDFYEWLKKQSIFKEKKGDIA